MKSLRPMNACGYFEITKSTLASMLEVRYLTLDLDIIENNLDFSVFYLIILMSFFGNRINGVSE